MQQNYSIALKKKKRKEEDTITEDFAYFRFCLFRENGLTHLDTSLTSATQKQIRLMEYLKDEFIRIS